MVEVQEHQNITYVPNDQKCVQVEYVNKKPYMAENDVASINYASSNDAH